VVVDNASSPPLNVELPSNGRIVLETKLGLYHANMAGFQEVRGTEIVVLVDDDNVLDPRYLENALRRMRENPKVGMAGGRNHAIYEVPPPEWLEAAGLYYLACRDFGDQVYTHSWDEITKSGSFVAHAPAGAGMILRRKVVDAYRALGGEEVSKYFDRRGKNGLASGNDNDIIMYGLSQGFQSAYFPDLALQHLLPKQRLTLEYSRRIHRATRRSWPLLFARHGVCTYSPLSRWTIPLRAARAWWRIKPWKGPLQEIQYEEALGLFEGRADLGDAFPESSARTRNLRTKQTPSR
jgi:glycosyltransferase involved in cell wall biosynthesis